MNQREIKFRAWDNANEVMKIEIIKNNIVITPAPKRNKKGGLKIWFWREEKAEDTTLPIATTDLIRGQREYRLPDEFKYAIKGIEF